jgi:hypothetical protein
VLLGQVAAACGQDAFAISHLFPNRLLVNWRSVASIGNRHRGPVFLFARAQRKQARHSGNCIGDSIEPYSCLLGA